MILHQVQVFYAHLPRLYWRTRPVETSPLSLVLSNLFKERAELWRVVLVLQAAAPLHLGVDNLNVVRHVGRLLDGVRNPCPAELSKDGDLILLIDRILEQRGRDTVRVTKVKGHADEEVV